jgi:membrane-bound lytic murein transglycosylase D
MIRHAAACAWVLVTLATTQGAYASGPARARSARHETPRGTSARTAPDEEARRRVTGATAGDGVVFGAESEELRELQRVEREIFPVTGVWWPDGEGTREQGLSLDGLALGDLPLRWHPLVRRYVDFFKNDKRGRGMFATWLKRSGRYRDAITRVLRTRSLPEDLLWVAMVESCFEPSAQSPVGARGLWQFMPDTGRLYGLRQDRWADERLNVEASTEAAADMLGDLHQRFGSWDLALAAYNMGYGAVSAVVRRYNTNDFWTLTRLEGALPWETTLYVPKILALALVARNAAAFGFADVIPERPLEHETVIVPAATSLATVAKAAGVTLKDVELLNPQLRAGRTPPGFPDGSAPAYPLHVPVGRGLAVAKALEGDKSDRAFERYVVRHGETLEQIASQRGVAAERIAELNALGAKEALRGGSVILLPTKREKVREPAAIAAKKSAGDLPVVVVADELFVYPDRLRAFYKVAPGDTLSGIAKAAGSSVDDVARWNALDPAGKLPDGLFLQLFVDGKSIEERMKILREEDVRIVRVGSDEFFNLSEANRGRRRKMIVAKAGETLESIGKRFGVSGASMERINRRARNDALEEGTPVVVYLAGRSDAPQGSGAKDSAGAASGDAPIDPEKPPQEN